MTKLPTLEDVKAAAARIKPQATRTPLLLSHSFSERMGARVFIKPECLQRTGSFKFRGAFNKISQIPSEDRARGVVAWSSGNHAQGVAAAAKLLDIRATIVMPKDAPQIKVEGTKAFGAEIIFFDRQTEDREAIGHKLVDETGATLVPSYDDPDIIAGQGTIGLEILEDLKAMGETPDQVVIPCGGGGLSSGVSLALRGLSPKAKVTIVEPEGYDDFARSLKSGNRETADVTQPSLCDALLTPTPGALTFKLNQENVSNACTVSDTEVRTAVREAFENLKLVVEPGGAVALAALLAGRIKPDGRDIVLILSGGNVDAGLFSQILGES